MTDVMAEIVREIFFNVNTIRVHRERVRPREQSREERLNVSKSPD